MITLDLLNEYKTKIKKNIAGHLAEYHYNFKDQCKIFFGMGKNFYNDTSICNLNSVFFVCIFNIISSRES